MTLTKASRMLVPSGAGAVYLLTHILPLMPGSRPRNLCVPVTLRGFSGVKKDRRTATVSAVRRSMYLACSDQRRI